MARRSLFRPIALELFRGPFEMDSLMTVVAPRRRLLGIACALLAAAVAFMFAS